MVEFRLNFGDILFIYSLYTIYKKNNNNNCPDIDGDYWYVALSVLKQDSVVVLLYRFESSDKSLDLKNNFAE